MTRVDGHWMENAETQRVMDVLTAAGSQAYFVGGCVRNALLGIAVNDVDIATDALPDQVMALAKSAEMKVIPTGIEHGTVTVISGNIPHEITTFRKDVETDGRRAVVSFSNELADDARRRDFTMNALYADADGVVVDPLGGLDDLQNRRVRFIEDAAARIREDYLRSLRFFRFYAWYGDQSEGVDTDGLAAVAENLDGLDTLSRERVGAEIKKLLSANDPAPAIATMAQVGVLARILPGTNPAALAPLVHFEGSMRPDPIRRLAVIGGEEVEDSLRLSRAELRQYLLLRTNAGGMDEPKVLGYRYGLQTGIDIVLVRAASLGRNPEPDFNERVTVGAAMVFPVDAADLMPSFKGEKLGAKLRELEDLWINSDFKLTKSQLLA